MLGSNFAMNTRGLIRKLQTLLTDEFISASSFVSISYSSSEKFAAQYLQLALESIGVVPIIVKRGKMPKFPTGNNTTNFHFPIIPSGYNNLFSAESDNLEREIKFILRSIPACHIIFIRTTAESSIKRVDSLIDSTKQTSAASVHLITLSTHDSFSSFTRKVANSIMPTPLDEVTKIYTPVEQLVYVRKDSLFSDLFFKMGTLGVRHCPVLERNGECQRIISRRDLVKLVPPGNMLIPREVQDKSGIEISSLKLINIIDELGDKKVGDLFPDQSLVSVSPSDSIEKAVELLSKRHFLGGKNIYISGLPVMDGKKLTGFISYTDILKRFIRFQEAYLKTTVENIATMSAEKPLWTLHEGQYLRDAVIRLENVRSLPVVDKPKSDRLVGFVEDVEIMAYNHSAFISELGALGVKYFMTPLALLYTPMPGQLLKDCLEKFWESSQGMYPASTLAVCNTSAGNDKRLMGVFSYVDILQKWVKWKAGEDNQEIKASQ